MKPRRLCDVKPRRERAFLTRDTRLTFLKDDPRLAALRKEPRFAALIRKLRLDHFGPGLAPL